MTNVHPAWCAATEEPNHEHTSSTLYAAEAADLIGIRMRLTQPDGVADLALLELEIIDNDKVTTYPLPLHQAKSLRDSLTRLLIQP